MGHCAGQIHGDSDIAGVGIISAIFVNAGLTIAVSTLLWIYIYIHLRKDHLEVPRSLPDWVQVVRSALVVQGDTQLIAALAIIITSLIHMKSDVDTPLYHTFIARSLVDVALTGHAAAVVHVYPTQHNWVSRFALLAATMFLWQWWTWLTIQLFRDSSRKAEHCFTNTNGLPGQYTSWIWTSLWSTPIGYIVLYLNTLENGRTLTNQFEEILMAGPTFVRKTFSFRQKTSKASCSRSDFVDVLRDVAISTGFIGIIFISWSFALLLPCSRILNPLQSLISFTWNLFDVSALHGANYVMLVENSEKLPKVSFQVFEDPEARRGFGQVLPFVMLLFPILAALDFYSAMYPNKRNDKEKTDLEIPFPVVACTSGQDLEANHGSQQRARLYSSLRDLFEIFEILRRKVILTGYRDGPDALLDINKTVMDHRSAPNRFP